MAKVKKVVKKSVISVVKGVEALKEILVTTPNEVGILASLTEAITGKGINILALSVSTAADKAWIHIITSDNAKALKAVSTFGWAAVERAIVRVSLVNKPGAAHAMSLCLASADVNIESAYAARWDAKSCSLIVVPSNVTRAIEVLKTPSV